MRKRINRCLLLVLIVLVSGCATVPMASPSLDAEAKKFMPEPELASIYVQRGGGLGSAVLFQLSLDGRMVGALAPHTYHLMSVTPGEHAISVTGQENADKATLTTEKGKTYFYKVNISIGCLSPHAHIESIDEEEGQRLISDSKRAETTIYK